jgi:hypothetical protein
MDLRRAVRALIHVAGRLADTTAGFGSQRDGQGRNICPTRRREDGQAHGIHRSPFEARMAGSRVSGFSAGTEPPEVQIQRLFTGNEAEWLQLRHAEAGCFIACIAPLSF